MPVHGRGTSSNPKNRFEPLSYDDSEWRDPEDPAPKTRFYRDSTRSIIAYNESPDVGFDASINPYRGCEHGCVYCFARPFHEYLGLSAGLDFETRIFVKERAPELLRAELRARSWVPQPIGVSGATDAYQPVERRFGLTRQCLEVLAEFRNPAFIITKNELVTRDVDVLQRMASHGGIAVCVSVTTLDPELARHMEPRASQPARRIEAIRRLSDAGVPVIVLVAPVIPAINDHEIPAILAAAAAAGARHAGYVLLRLPFGVADLFDEWLSGQFPDRREKVLNRLRAMRGGALYKSGFGQRMRGDGPFADEVRALFQLGCRRAGIDTQRPVLDVSPFRNPGRNLTLPFDGASG